MIPSLELGSKCFNDFNDIRNLSLALYDKHMSAGVLLCFAAAAAVAARVGKAVKHAARPGGEQKA